MRSRRWALLLSSHWVQSAEVTRTHLGSGPELRPLARLGYSRLGIATDMMYR